MQESDEHPLSHLTPVGYKPMAPCDSQCGANLRRWHPAVGRGRAVTELIPQALFPEVGFVYLTGINLVTFLVYGADKRRARRGRWRIPEVTLLALALLGGAGGALLAMVLFHHKTRKARFYVTVPLALTAQLVLIGWLLSLGVN